MKKLFCVLSLAACLCMAGPLTANAASEKQAKEYQVFTLGQVVVSEKTSHGNQGATISSFTAEQIRDTHAASVPEALSYIPGVTVTTGFKNEPDIRIHGFQQYEALILIDGVPYYETNYGKLNLNQLPTEMVARIDVIKGAPSVLYGAGAMGGVINIITKQAGKKMTASASAEAGNDGRYRLGASLGDASGKVKYWFSASRQEADAWRLSDDFTPSLGSIVKKPGGTTKAVLEDGGKRNNSDFSQTSLWGKIGLEPSAGSKYYLSSYYLDSSWGFPISTREVIMFPNRPAFSRFARMDKYRDYGVDLSGEQKLGSSFKLTGKLFYHKHEDDFVSYAEAACINEIATSTYRDYMLGGSLIADWALHPKDSLRFALHYRTDSHEERDDAYLPFAESISFTGSLAVENEWAPFKGFSLVTGISYDWFQVDKAQSVSTDKNGDWASTDDLPTGSDKDAFNPMIAASYVFGDRTRLYGSVARKTRFPTLQQLFSSKGGNTSLKPQESINYTLGVKRPFGKKSLAGASVFYYDISERISRDAPYPDALYHNYAKVVIYGFEVSGQTSPIKDLTLRLGYTFLEAEDQSDDRVTDNVIGVPQHKVDLGVTYTLPGLGTRLHAEGLFMAEQWNQLPTAATPTTEALKTSGYVVVNLRISQPIGKHLSVFAFVSNLTDEDYESDSGFPAPGRNYWVGVKTTF